jgi:uncharacterized membrane protein YoaK (UPF0700 family)
MADGGTTTRTSRLRWRERDPLPPTLVILTGVTGIIDAVCFLGMSEVFAANMTGNIVLLGFSVAGSDDPETGGRLIALVAFVVGALVAGRLTHRLVTLEPRRWLLLLAAVNIVLLTMAAVFAIGLPLNTGIGDQWPILVCVGLAMGYKNAAARRLGVADLNTTVVTSTLVGLVVDNPVAGGDAVRPIRRLAAIASLFLGALLGAVLVLNASITIALLVAMAISAGAVLLHAAHPAARAVSTTP